MAKPLTSNVPVPNDEGGVTWYGPAYSNAEDYPADKVKNPAAFAVPVEVPVDEPESEPKPGRPRR